VKFCLDIFTIALVNLVSLILGKTFWVQLLLNFNNRTCLLEVHAVKKVMPIDYNLSFQVVGESGLFTPEDISYVQNAGVKAVCPCNTLLLII